MGYYVRLKIMLTEVFTFWKKKENLQHINQNTNAKWKFGKLNCWPNNSKKKKKILRKHYKLLDYYLPIARFFNTTFCSFLYFWIRNLQNRLKQSKMFTLFTFWKLKVKNNERVIQLIRLEIMPIPKSHVSLY